MAQPEDLSRMHDLLSACLGGMAALLLACIPWQIDSSGPEPFYKGPVIFPLIVLACMVLASLPAAFRLVRPKPGASWVFDGHGAPRKPAAVAGMLVLFILGMIFLGLEISTFLFLFASIHYLKQRSFFRLVVLPLLVTGIVYLMFKYLLDIYFPTPLLFEWMGF